MWMWKLFLSLMIISSWNVNSVRVRLNHIIEYLKKNKPSFLLLQEIKTENKNFPYSELKGLFPPDHNFASLAEAAVVVDMFNFYFSAKILAIKDICIKKLGFFGIIFNNFEAIILSSEGRQKGRSKVCLQNASR